MYRKTLFLMLLLFALISLQPTALAEDAITAGMGRDPATMYDYGAHPPLTRVLEPLIFKDLELGLKPGLAESWDTSADALNWTIKLREGVSFHDGTPFNAESVVHNIRRAAEVWPGRFGPVERIEVLEEHKVKITHSEPFAPFLYTLAWPGAAMISPRAVDDEGNIEEPIGTGPFIRESWTADEEMVLVANDDYWGTSPRLERITLKVIPDATTRMMALEAGEIDMIIDTGGVLPEQVPTLKLHDDIELMSVAGAVPHYMSLNTAESPLDDVRVRRAIMHAIDPASIIQYALEGQGEVMSSIIPYSEMDWMHPEDLYQFNRPEKAEELLDQAGWNNINSNGIRELDGKECQLSFVLASGLIGRWPYQTIAEIIQHQLKEVGIRVEIEVMETGLWRETLQKSEADLSIRPWAGISPHNRLYDWLHSEGSNTLAMGIFYQNSELDEAIEELMSTPDDDQASDLMTGIQETAAEELPLIPIYDEVLINAVRDNVKGYTLHPWFTVNWEDIYLE